MESFNNNFEELAANWTKAQPIVGAFIASVVADMHEVDNILQEVALAIVRSYGNYDKKRPFIAWAIGIAKNEILMYRRGKSRDRHTFNNEILEQAAKVYLEKANDLIDTKRALRQCVSQLQPKWRKMLELRYSMGLEVKMVARQMGISVNAAFIALHRIRLALRKCILHRLSVGEV